MTDSSRTVLGLAAQIVTAHVRHNDVAIDAVPRLIRSVYRTLAEIGGQISLSSTDLELASPVHNHYYHDDVDNSEPDYPSTQEGFEHPVYGQTVFDNQLICMEDGLSMKMLKRHLLTVHGMTPEEYRAKWGLPDEYPMVALSYAKLRSNLALQSGLGLKPDARSGKQRGARGGASLREQLDGD